MVGKYKDLVHLCKNDELYHFLTTTESYIFMQYAERLGKWHILWSAQYNLWIYFTHNTAEKISRHWQTKWILIMAITAAHQVQWCNRGRVLRRFREFHIWRHFSLTWMKNIHTWKIKNDWMSFTDVTENLYELTWEIARQSKNYKVILSLEAPNYCL
jgi:hypothetical protein